ncbi:hypothetical protein BC941DRAFT_501573 [Chlamydoabsidia padenii]|nr:hypothetical protein BC941DRAFT_501573 [Chlamydoabsidia padenii]
MREPNLCFPSHNKAAVCITSLLYDRRALDCTASLPLINSLTQLAYLTSTSPRIREILVLDGGLERLVRILSPQYLEPERRNLWKWSLAFQCVVNVGVRGTEQIRTKVVDAGMIPIVLRVLENFLRALELVRQESDRQDNNNNNNNNNLILTSTTSSSSSTTTQHADYTNHQGLLEGLLTHSTAQQLDGLRSTIPSSILNIANLTSSANNDNTMIPTTANDKTSHGKSISPRQEHRVLRKSTFPYIKITAAQRRRNRLNRTSKKTVPTWQDPREPNIDNVFYREEDILLSLQLLAYLSKYPHIRDQFHTNYDRNVFSVVERFCHRLHPNPIQYWAGVIMRNACRKDETKGGTRRCANMHCGKWESQPREFAKCRRCRKAKYCCKACQSKAWSDGHRWWCVERHATVPPPPQQQQQESSTTQEQPQQIAQNAELAEQRHQLVQQQLLSEELESTTGTGVSTGDLQRQRSTTPTPSNNREGNMHQQRSESSTTIAGESNSVGTNSQDRRGEQNDGAAQLYQARAGPFRRHHAFHHLLSTPTTTVPTMNPIARRLYSPTQQQEGQHQPYHHHLQQQQQQQSPTSQESPMNDLSHNNNNNRPVQEDSSQSGSTETSDNRTSLILDVGMQMEI